MRICVIYLGKTSSKEIESLSQEYFKRCGKYCQIEIKSLSLKKKVRDPFLAKKEEGRLLIQNISSDDYVILLDEKGKQKSSKKLAEDIRKYYVHSSKRMVFVIGGAYGFSEELYSRADEQLALSTLTMNHELALLVLAEQLFRSMAIIHNHPYHND